MSHPVHVFRVVPRMLPKLKRLLELAYNLRWSWDHDTIDLFRRLDHDLWETNGHNPVQLLGSISQERLEEAARDSGFVVHLERVCRHLDEYMASRTTWYERAHGNGNKVRLAYFCSEFGLTECLPFYAGGLGILAGDHLKSASDLGLPLVGVGLLYQEGYFRQHLNRDGWQQDLYPSNDFHHLPLKQELNQDGEPLTIEVPYPGRHVKAEVWRAQVGRVPLFLLNTNVSGNGKEGQDITKRLYPSDLERRLRQEIMLGIGGFQALKTMGIHPTVCHLNEGHTAFVAVERIRDLIEEQGLTFAEAREAASGNIFTTHTPVRAGIDMFPAELMDKYFSSYYTALRLSREEFLALGRQNPKDDREPFCMAILALRLSSQANGVSQQHGIVARQMWQNLWPGIPEDEVPISSVTNGIHHPSWISGHDVAPVLIRYLGERWLEEPADPEVWHAVEHIPDEELWRTHERRRERLVAFARRRLQTQLERRGAPAAEIAMAGEVLDPGVLTIGFGRRFATYKRATLLLRDPERLVRILTNRERPVQVIFAGKAHPEDTAGKEMIRHIVHFARQEEVRRRMAFVEDYDIVVARYMVQGADVWLNTAYRLQEASGTSGMKAAANGVINISILDGWWVETPHPQSGWTIGCGDDCPDPGRQDEVESQDLYDLLEKEVIPEFYNRGSDHLPRAWISRMKASMRAVCPQFNTHRMVHEYCERFYLPAAERQQRLSADRAARARALAQWKAKLVRCWPYIQVTDLETGGNGEVKFGSNLKICARVHLGELTAEEVSVELYHGPVNTQGQIVAGQVAPMNCVRRSKGDGHLFEGHIPCRTSGLYGYSVRILPRHDDLGHPHELGHILWVTS